MRAATKNDSHRAFMLHEVRQVRFPGFGCYALTSCAAVASLAGCAEKAGSVSVPPVNGVAVSHSKTFFYVDKKQSFRVPDGVTWITVLARGASGGSNSEGSAQGRGGRVVATIPVTPGERLAVFVGGAGSQTAGGFNGGGNVNSGSQDDYLDYKGYGGGGASDVRQGGDRLSDRVVVAGGGGGQGGFDYFRRCRIIGQGGGGGGSTAGSGKTGYTPWCYQSRSESWPGFGGTGGTQKAGGVAASAEEVTLELPATRGSPAAAETEAPAGRAAPGHLVRRARVGQAAAEGADISAAVAEASAVEATADLAAVAAAGEGPLISSLTRKRFTVGEVGRMQPEAASSY